jgi:hypothetical protein
LGAKTLDFLLKPPLFIAVLADSVSVRYQSAFVISNHIVNSLAGDFLNLATDWAGNQRARHANILRLDDQMTAGKDIGFTDQTYIVTATTKGILGADFAESFVTNWAFHSIVTLDFNV